MKTPPQSREFFVTDGYDPRVEVPMKTYFKSIHLLAGVALLAIVIAIVLAACVASLVAPESGIFDSPDL